MDKLTQLREERARIITQSRSLIDESETVKDEARAAELEGQADKALLDAKALDAKIEREELLQEAESRQKEMEQRQLEQRRPGQEPKQVKGADDPVTPEYRDAFESFIRRGASEMTAGERSVLMEGRAQSVGTDNKGGYTVPEGFSGEIDRSMAAWGPMWDANIVRELNTTTGNKIPWPTVDDTANTGRAKAENADVDDDGSDDVTFGEKELDAYIYDTGMVRIPLELLTDSAFAMEPLLDDLFGERLGRLANQVLTTGTGSSQPNGIVTASGLGHTAAGTAAITSDEIIDLLHSVDPAYRASPRCRFMFNDTTLAAIRKLKDGDGNYLWQMGDVRSGEPSQLLDQPYSVNQAMDSLAAAKKVMIFGDLSRYVVRKVNGFSVMTLRERYAEKFQIGMVGFKRFDGELLNANAVKHLITAAS